MWYPQILPAWLSRIFPGVVIRGVGGRNTVHLTFDDGPIPEVTPWILDVLQDYQQKATFFCVGENVRKYPEIFQRIKDEGHGYGNHTMNHLAGWENELGVYVNNVEEADALIQSRLFRPPYGQLTPSQYLELKKKYAIVMWSYLSADYEPAFSVEKCLDEVEKNSSNGCVLVFHDNVKTADKVKDVLPRILEFYKVERITSLPISG